MNQKRHFLLKILAGVLLVMLLSPNLALAQTDVTSINSMNNVISTTVLIATTLAGLFSLILGLIKFKQIATDPDSFGSLLGFMLMPFMSIVILATFNFIFDGQWNLGLTLSLALNGAVFGNFLLIVCRI